MFFYHGMLIILFEFLSKVNKRFIFNNYIDVINNNRSIKIANIRLMKMLSIERITLFLNLLIPMIRPDATIVHQRISKNRSLNFAVISVGNKTMSSSCSKSTPTPHNDGLF